jgi:hypothetical protein
MPHNLLDRPPVFAIAEVNDACLRHRSTGQFLFHFLLLLLLLLGGSVHVPHAFFGLDPLTVAWAIPAAI